ncbi:alpha-(1,3)-fucosyltransferase C-like [Physella acuta]|uniref:alpha-(1,3)-fucosyltransferase C-like n=1 Tax=Physella acuta TaxID=109671 RepID=UPI0027DD13DE|nr:alpha-(1,3)-fucosyltransferase C-like [Physella acuta]
MITRDTMGLHCFTTLHHCNHLRVLFIVLAGSGVLFYMKTFTDTTIPFPSSFAGITNKPQVIVTDKPKEFSSPETLEMPYISQETNKAKIKSNKTFRVAVLERPLWQLEEDFDFSVCEYSNCVFSGDKVTHETDVIVVYSQKLTENYKLPSARPDALYVMELWEPPVRTSSTYMRNSSSKWNHIFNLTMTYRVDSDIFVPYGQLRKKSKLGVERPNYSDLTRRKTRSVAWFVSRCHVPSLRAEYVKEMQKYIDVDIYGDCGMPCSRSEEPCLKNLTDIYKFYLSFENSICKDYITEKLFKLFRPGVHVIPVVRGGGDYKKFFPKNLFINAADFKNAKSLALYLKNLTGDVDRYSRMLEMKDEYQVMDKPNANHKGGLGFVGCRLCQYLNTHKVQPKVYDMKKWWGDDKCTTPNDIV